MEAAITKEELEKERKTTKLKFALAFVAMLFLSSLMLTSVTTLEIANNPGFGNPIGYILYGIADFLFAWGIYILYKVGKAASKN